MGGRRIGVLRIGSVCIVVSLLGPPLFASSAAAQTDASDAGQRLAQRYAPVLMLVRQDAPCDTSGEPFRPMAVDAILNNPDVALRQVGTNDPVVKWGPSAADLFGRGRGFYLDFPGSALEPGCIYEQDFRRYAGDHSTVYAHIARQADRPDLLALQYWFYWYFNDWNNKHESDWEGIQLLFHATDAEQALSRQPFAVDYAQHEGGEKASWDDRKLERDGTHPVVYSSARSHASYFSSEVYLGRGASEGFGCDDTAGPSVRVEPDVVLLPDRVDRADDPLAWLGFEGTWGERHRGSFNAPTGVTTKGRWTAPITWHDRLRRASVTVPAGNTAAHDVIDGFCSVVTFGSRQLIELQLSPLRVVVTLAFLAAIVRFLVRRTSWEPVAAAPLVRRRRAGQIARSAVSIFRSRPGYFLGIAALAVPVGGVAALVVELGRVTPLVGPLIDLIDSGGAARLALSAVGGAFAVTIAFTFTIAMVTAGLAGTDGNASLTVSETLAAVRRRGSVLLKAFALVAIADSIAVATIVGAPLALYLLIRWQFLPQAIMLEDATATQALKSSARIVRRRFWHTAIVVVAASGIVLTLGSVVALIVLVVFSSVPLWALSIVVTAVSAAAMPVGAIALTLLYGDAVAQNRGDPAEHVARAGDAYAMES